jgi:lysyl-tRNA synthetase, class II
MTERDDPLFEQRLAKAERLRARGVDPYPPRAQRTHTTAEALAAFSDAEAAGQESMPGVVVSGRIRTLRNLGKAAFFDLIDGEGKLQIYCRQDELGEQAFALLSEVDLADIVQVEGSVMRTRRGEVSLLANDLTVLAKALRPPPEKWHGVTDAELKYRQRYLDLMSSEETRQRFANRSRIIAAMRRFMDARGFLEVETPVLLAEAGGAAAKPFQTYFNALGEERLLRISLELYLKRLLVGGFDKVYEIGRIFRNEGLDTTHNPEFTMMESYEAYTDYRGVAQMVEQLVSSVAAEVLGTLTIAHGESEIDLTPPWRRLTMRDALIDYAGLDMLSMRDETALRGWMREKGLHAAPELGWGKLIDEVVSAFVQPHLQQPTFLLDYPVELSPLAKRKPDEPSLVERFEAFVGGFEIANAYTELNDPVDQRERFAAQASAQARGDEETELFDEDFLVALEHGMPPAGGLGVGIDRLLMILLNEPSIREVILFPQLRSPKRTTPAAADKA